MITKREFYTIYFLALATLGMLAYSAFDFAYGHAEPHIHADCRVVELTIVCMEMTR